MSHGQTPAEQAAQDKRIKLQLSAIKYPVLVMSGKGGVGKSTVAVNLAWSLSQRGFKVGIMDIDIHGPNVPKMLGIDKLSFGGDESRIEPVRVNDNLVAASLGLIGYHPDQAIVWRGPIKIGLIRQFLADVAWGELDYLIIDTPPGTGDESLTIAQTVHNLAGAVVVTTPQEVSVLDSRKSLDFAKKLNVHVLGLVENMSGFVCPCCNTVTHIFSQGGGKKAAEELAVPFAGVIPLEAGVVGAGDSGKAFLSQYQDGPVADAMNRIVDNVLAQIANNEKNGLYQKTTVNPDFRPER